ncbi:response regulator [Paenibacillus glycanilyticus]|uniref:AraC family transcriptional regulator n=1 Tax=Paenibacillus glycanilyticus TaxID=126569 RepID=A0ABQ6GCC9_9BACL|nr:response regulator [Paenibacillus glycanilyticus]GLX68604.1 AraC family transcriptional regulator [Paenibacillus glycanilyticus]
MYRVILVDDEAIIRQGIKKIIQRFAPDWEVVGEAEDGVSGLQQVVRLQPDLVILDFRMPGLNGLECCERIAAESVRVHRIILTAYQDFRIAKEAIRHGVSGFITKPLDRAELLDTLAATSAVIDREREEQQQLSLLQHTVRKAAPLAQQLYVQHYLTGHDIYELEQFIVESGYGLPFATGSDHVVVLAVSPDWIEKGSFSPFDVELFLYALTKFVQEWFANKPRSYVLQDHAGQIIVIHSYSAHEKELADRRTAELAELLRADIAESFKRTVSVGMSSIRPIADSPRAYQEASLAVSYRFVYGSDQLLSPDKLEADKQLPLRMLEQMEASIEQLLQGNEDAAYAMLGRIVFSEPIAPAQLKRFIVHYMLRLAVQMKQMDLDVNETSGKPLSIWLSELEDTATRESLMSKLKAIIHQLCQSILKERSLVDLKSAEKAKQYVRDYLADGVSLQAAADHMGMNASYFSRWFKYATGRNFVDYLKDCRIEKAKELLQRGSYSLQEISTLIGYADVKYFCRVFKELTGSTPSEYKKRFY